nr:hypothetical protein [Tanacetum cinerariifolium]
KKLKLFKKSFKKLLFEKGNLHENVKRLRFKLDKVQRDLDSDPYNVCLREEEAMVVFADGSVATAFVSHYEAFLGQPANSTPFNNVKLFPNQLDVKDAAAMEAWDLVANDVTKAIQEFFVNGTLLKELNHTIIALIPKVASPPCVNDYRPISCRTVLFKCISKIITNRIKDSLKYLISLNQSAFVPGRRILDNILLTQELMHNYHLNRGEPRCAFKVDIQKADDTVDLDFLKDVLLAFGFHNQMVEEVLGKVCKSNSFTYHRYCSEMEIINLCFADDLFLFAHGNANLASVIMEALDEFKHVSGLVPKSLWVKWIHIYKLRGCNFWDVPLRGNMTWGWRKILQLRPMVRDFIWHKIRPRSNVSVWFDRWCSSWPLSTIISMRDIHRAGYNMSTKVINPISNGIWKCPQEWRSKYPHLTSVTIQAIGNYSNDTWSGVIACEWSNSFWYLWFGIVFDRKIRK